MPGRNEGYPMIELMVLAVLVVQMAARVAAALIVPGYAPHAVANVGIQHNTNPNRIGNRVLRAPWMILVFSFITLWTFNGLEAKFFGFAWAIFVYLVNRIVTKGVLERLATRFPEYA